MSGTQPVAVYALKVPPGEILIPAVPDFAAMFRVSMAAIDPSAAPDFDDVEDTTRPKATLKIVRFPDDLIDESDSEDDYAWSDEDDEEDDEESSDEEENGGPSDKSKRPSKKDIMKALAKAEAMEDEDDEADSESEDDEAAARAILSKIKKGKAKSTGSEDEDSDEDDDDDESIEVEEIVVCTLDPEKHYQQPLDIVVGERERIFFKVTGTHTVHLTGNYVIPMDDGQASLYDDDDEDEDDYDLSPGEDELDELEDDEESDELDDVDDPRVMEVDSDKEEAPKLVKSGSKGKNKRPADDSEEDANLDDLIAKAGEGNGKLSKSQQKKLKKQKTNDGEAVTSEAAKPAANGEKKVQFAKNLEQGPTPSPAPKETKKDDKKEEKKETGTTGSLGIKTIQGVVIDDKKLGKGPAAKKGNKVGMRYIGKLENGKVFDSNKKGKPFQFKLGAGEVIKGWDIGIAGLAVGGERRITIPAHLGYGSRGAPPDIPPNSKLIFDVKMLEIK